LVGVPSCTEAEAGGAMAVGAPLNLSQSQPANYRAKSQIAKQISF
jgi:hypothetical protein